MTEERLAEIEKEVNCYSKFRFGEMIRELIAALREARQDTKRLDFVEQQTRKSYTGVGFDFYKEGNEPQFRMMWRHHIGDPRYTLRRVIDSEMETT